MTDLRLNGGALEAPRLDGAPLDGASLDDAALDEMATTDGRWPREVAPGPGTRAPFDTTADAATEVVRAVARARNAQVHWAQCSLAERCHRMESFRDALARRAEELAERLVIECGGPLDEAQEGEVEALLAEMARLIDSAPAALRERDVESSFWHTGRSQRRWVPRGVVAILSDHHSPLAGPLRDVVAAALGGNAAVVKPSGHAPRVVLDAKAIWDESEMPSDLFQVVTGPAGTAAALIVAAPDLVTFSGGLAAARRVAAACGARLLPCHVRAMGRGPLLACIDAEVERAARSVVRGAFGDAGRSSAPIGPVYAHTRVHDRMVERVAALAGAWTLGDGGEGAVKRGSATPEDALQRVEDHVARAIADGAVLHCGGRRRPGGTFFEPTVLSECTPAMSVMTQDTGAPLACFVCVSNDDEAVRLANAAGPAAHVHVFTDSWQRAARIAPLLQAEWVLVNHLPSDRSTWERSVGPALAGHTPPWTVTEGLQQMCIAKQVDSDRFPAGAPAWQPAASRAGSWLQGSAATLVSSGARLRRALTR